MYVYRNGQTVRSHSLVLRSITNSHRSDTRFAVVVSKKVLKSAVRRNRIRRRLYEYIRINIMPELDGVYDIVVIVSSSEFLNMAHSDMTDQISQLFNQSDIQKITKTAQK